MSSAVCDGRECLHESLHKGHNYGRSTFNQCRQVFNYGVSDCHDNIHADLNDFRQVFHNHVCETADCVADDLADFVEIITGFDQPRGELSEQFCAVIGEVLKLR